MREDFLFALLHADDTLNYALNSGGVVVAGFLPSGFLFGEDGEVLFDFGDGFAVERALVGETHEVALLDFAVDFVVLCALVAVVLDCVFDFLVGCVGGFELDLGFERFGKLDFGVDVGGKFEFERTVLVFVLDVYNRVEVEFLDCVELFNRLACEVAFELFFDGFGIKLFDHRLRRFAGSETGDFGVAHECGDYLAVFFFDLLGSEGHDYLLSCIADVFDFCIHNFKGYKSARFPELRESGGGCP